MIHGPARVPLWMCAFRGSCIGVLSSVRSTPPSNMEGKMVIFGFLIAAVVIHEVLCRGQPASLCRPNERLLECGCPKTCEDPAPSCAAVCKMGCFCEEGQVRNATGHCVKLADCPRIMAAYKQDTTEPRANNGDCPEFEEYRFCEPCNRTCANPDPPCPAQCARGCFCKDNLLRDTHGKCVAPEKCFDSVDSMAYQLTCSEHQVYKPCETCERTCSNPSPQCPSLCKVGCFCEDKYVKAPDETCVTLDKCPKAEMTMGTANSPSVEECGSDEAYFSCGWCEPSCEQPTPACPAAVCTTGCLCRPPLLRHHSGHCVEEHECLPQKCPDTNEEYICRYGCEARCDMRPCSVRARRCSLGCHCKLGLLRDQFTGLCVTLDQCSNATNSLDDVASLADDSDNVYHFKIAK